MALPPVDTPGSHDLLFVQGNRLERRFAWDHNSVAVPLAGYRVESQIKTSAGGTLILDLASYVTIEPGGATGVISLSIGASITRGITRGGVWDLFVINASDPNDAVKLLSGRVTVEKAVSIDDGA